MKFFKIFKKKPPPSSPRSTNLVCNIHWAETVQREMAHTASKEPATSPRQVRPCYMTILGVTVCFRVMMYNSNAVVNNSPQPCDINHNHNIDNRNHNQRIVSNNNSSYQSRISGVWQSGTDSDTFSGSEPGNSWSSVSLSSSTKTHSAEPFPDEHFSR